MGMHRGPLQVSQPCEGACITQWSSEPCHAEPPKTVGSWRRGGTKHGPLEKGMANPSMANTLQYSCLENSTNRMKRGEWGMVYYCLISIEFRFHEKKRSVNWWQWPQHNVVNAFSATDVCVCLKTVTVEQDEGTGRLLSFSLPWTHWFHNNTWTNLPFFPQEISWDDSITKESKSSHPEAGRRIWRSILP